MPPLAKPIYDRGDGLAAIKPIERLLAALETHGCRPKPAGEGTWQAHCPAHDDRSPSLSIREAEDGRVLLHDFGGCESEAVAAALGLAMRDLFPGEGGSSRDREAATTYDYTDEEGRLLFRVERQSGKRFRQCRPDGKGGWIYNLQNVRRVLYRLPEVAKAVKEQRRIYIVEGEKDADRLANFGLCATTNPMGAGKWRDEYGESFRGAAVVIIPDNDAPGKAHAEQVAASLVGRAASVRVLTLPGLPEKGDVSDWLSAGHTVAELEGLAAQTPSWQAQERVEAIARKEPTRLQPPAAAAFHGLFGEIVDLFDPETEADRVAVLAQTLVAFGSAAGRNAFFVVEQTRHYPNLYIVLVGETSHARKGTSWRLVRELFARTSSGNEWIEGCLEGGLSSGEGLIWRVRDPIREYRPPKGEAAGRDYEEVIIDGGIVDKRLCVVEGEFASPLRVMTREGNTLSEVLRGAWDDGVLGSLTKNQRARATGAHVSLVGHITKDELLRYFDSTEAANGFGNRILWLRVQRSKLKPEGGRIDEEALRALE